jgi:hypothetical protein
VHFKTADVDIDVAGNVARQALDFDFAQHLVQDAAGSFYAHRNAQQLHAHFDAEGLVQCNALQVDVDQLVFDRLALPIDDHGLGRGLACDFYVKNRVVAGLGKQNPGNLLGIHFNGHRIVAGTIKNCGNLAGNAHAAGGILGELALTGLGYDYFWHFGLSFPSDRARPLEVRSLCEGQGSGVRVQGSEKLHSNPVFFRPVSGC